MQSATPYSLYLDAARRYSDRTALLYKSEGKFERIRHAELLKMVDTAAANLLNLGIHKGDTVGIFSTNRPEWAITDLAACKLGAVVVPVYPSTPATALEFILNDARIKMLVVENSELLQTAMTARLNMSSNLDLIVINSKGVDDAAVLQFENALLTQGEAGEASYDVSSKDIASIVYTSGTSGTPKGVVLTHANIIANVQAVITRFRVTHRDVTVSYLPLCHMFERTCGYYSVLFCGGSVAYAESLDTVREDVAAIRPTVLIAVPRVLEKAFEKSVNAVHRKSSVGQWLVASCMRNLNHLSNLKYQNDSIPLSLRIKCFLLNGFVGSGFRHLAGGRLRLVASGGAPLDKNIAKAFHILGFNIVEGYGLTETSPVVACNSPVNNKLGTVGKPLDGVQVKLGKDDEILVKGPNVMRGYLNNPEATREVIDQDGWFHTGDQGVFDEEGYLKITGRIKDLIVTSYGKNISAAAIESRINASPFISQVLVVGDRKKYITALVVPDWTAVGHWAKGAGIKYDSILLLAEGDSVVDLIQTEVAEATKGSASYEKPKDFRII
ncbi:long-chain fatty acid--CoA ligase, partial [bacterium]|nr:long-chain fatty acid--CoA ligase [bacterium]